jgi:uncharacterized SAM-binding protein YcdF (DUF218 family)
LAIFLMDFALRNLPSRILWPVMLVAALAIIAAAAKTDRAELFRIAADLWTVSDKIGPADAVAVFGGGAETRAVAAADYYRRGLVRKVLVANVRLSEVGPNIFHSETELNRTVLVEKGVPADAIEIFGTDVSSTYEEAAALREWVLRSHAHSLIVPTEFFSSRRVRWIVKHELADTGARVAIPALDYPQFSRNDWWTNDYAFFLFRTEILKYFYYRLRY